MSINLKIPDIRELKPRITVFGVGGAGGNAVNNMINAGLQGVDFVVANTDAQALTMSRAERIIQMGVQATEGLGAGSQPDVGRAAAEEVIDEIRDHLTGAHMVFVTAGMGGGTGTGASPVVARAARELGILTVGVVTKPFHFEGQRRMRLAESGIMELQKSVDTLIIIPNQNLFRVANEKTTFADAFAMADQVLYSGVACITDLMVKEGLINLDFADVRAVMREMGKAMMGTGEASGDKRALRSAEAAICNPLIDDVSMRGARGLLISITGGKDLTLYEVDEAATRIREEVDADANIIVGATFDESLDGIIRVSVVATGVDINAADNARPAGNRRRPTGAAGARRRGRAPAQLPPRRTRRAQAGRRSRSRPSTMKSRIAELAQRLKADNARIAERSRTCRARRRVRRARAAQSPAGAGRHHGALGRTSRCGVDRPGRHCGRRGSPAPRAAKRSRSGRCRRSRACSPSRRTSEPRRRPQSQRAQGLHSAAAGTAGRNARRACRLSRNCRCRDRTSSGRGAASRPKRSIPKSAASPCCSASPRSGLGGARTRTEQKPERPGGRSRPAPPSAGPASTPRAAPAPPARAGRRITRRGSGFRVCQAGGPAGPRRPWPRRARHHPAG